MDKDKLGRTVLHAAAGCGQREAVEFLCRRGLLHDEKLEFVERLRSEGGVSNVMGGKDWRPKSAVKLPGQASRLGSAASVGFSHLEDGAEEGGQRRGPAVRGAAGSNGGVHGKFLDADDSSNGGSFRGSSRGASFEGRELLYGDEKVEFTPTSSITEDVPGGRGRQQRRASVLDGNTLPVPRVGQKEGDERLLNARDNVGDTAMHLAASAGHEDVVEALISWQAEVDTRNLAGRTPLHAASMNAHLGCIEMLLRAGANPRVRDLEMRRPADMCPLREVYDALVDAVGQVNAVSGGPTPFGKGDGDRHVKRNRRDGEFASTKHPEVLVGNAGPNYIGCSMPRVRPKTPPRPYRAFGRGPEKEEGADPDGGAARARGDDYDPNGFFVPPAYDKAGNRIAGGPTLKMSSSWYRGKETLRLQVPAQVLRSTTSTGSQRMRAQMYWGKRELAKELAGIKDPVE
jgi:hypothetical protein